MFDDVKIFKVLQIDTIAGKNGPFQIAKIYDPELGVLDLFRKTEDKTIVVGQDLECTLSLKNYSGKLVVRIEEVA